MPINVIITGATGKSRSWLVFQTRESDRQIKSRSWLVFQTRESDRQIKSRSWLVFQPRESDRRNIHFRSGPQQ